MALNLSNVGNISGPRYLALPKEISSSVASGYPLIYSPLLYLRVCTQESLTVGATRILFGKRALILIILVLTTLEGQVT